MTTRADDPAPLSAEELDELERLSRRPVTDDVHVATTLGLTFRDLRRLIAAARHSALPAAPGVEGLNPDTAILVQRFGVALAEKLRAAEVKYGHGNGWLDANWKVGCVEQLREHVEKGDPLDVAAYAAFCWHHRWPTNAYSAPPAAHPALGVDMDANAFNAFAIYLPMGSDERALAITTWLAVLNYQRGTISAPARFGKPSQPEDSGQEGNRPCTCPPDCNRPFPCPRKYALGDCLLAARQEAYKREASGRGVGESPVAWVLRNVDTGALVITKAAKGKEVIDARVKQLSDNYCQYEAIPLFLRAAQQPAAGVADDPVNDPKYAFRDGRVWNRADGLSVPDDEPVMVFRARDRKALDHALTPYMFAVANPDHAKAVQGRMDSFRRFASDHPERMKEPGTAILAKLERPS